MFNFVTLSGYQILMTVEENNKDKSTTKMINVFGSAFVGLLAGVFSYPLDTLKRIKQVNGLKEMNPYSEITIVDSVRNIRNNRWLFK